MNRRDIVKGALALGIIQGIAGCDRGIEEASMADNFTLDLFDTNGIRLRAALEGEGPLVILVHGWPELWYSWRHQIRAVAEAGFRVVAPDVRGYGGSDKPHPVEAYDMLQLTADVAGLIDTLDEEQAILVGHDWGAPICWNTALLYPDRVRAVAGLSVPYFPRGEISSIELYKRLYAGRFFYQLYFQEEGVAEAEFEADVRKALRQIYYLASGDRTEAVAEVMLAKKPGDDMLGGLPDPDPFPDWLSAADLDYYTAAFTEGGFRGPLNRYRAQHRDWELLADYAGHKIAQPSCLIAGTLDPVRSFAPGLDLYQQAGAHCTDYRGTTLIDGEGHWIQQEAPDSVNRALLAFLSGVA
jgi:pimeloyl-ACP methyl ester carboxylesterase